jgi:hypothetical protein
VNATGAGIVATANPGCMLQLEAGVRMHGKGQKVMHVVELLDRAYGGLPHRPLLILILQLIQLPVNPPQRE